MSLATDRVHLACIAFAAMALLLCMAFIPANDDSIGPTPLACAVPSPRVTPVPRPTVDFIIGVDSYQYLMNGVVNGSITLTRGHTYSFDLLAFGDEHPFVINSNASNPWGTIYLPGSHGAVVTFTPTASMPTTIFYHCEVHYGSMVGTITLVGPPVCAGDLNTDALVNSLDFGIFVNAFGSSCSACPSDLDGNGAVNSVDFGIFVNGFGNSCG